MNVAINIENSSPGAGQIPAGCGGEMGLSLTHLRIVLQCGVEQTRCEAKIDESDVWQLGAEGFLSSSTVVQNSCDAESDFLSQ
jgi:hypothetical protein